MTTKAQERTQAQENSEPTGLAAAIAYEEAIAIDAAEVRGEAKELTPQLLMELWPLLRRPIPEPLIQHVPPTKGKPYESTGVRSVQVQIDRMDRVLTPLWWWEESNYSEDGMLCHVRVFVGSDRERPLYSRDSWGGVEQGSTRGNIRKGSFTNAAKLALARVGPGWEIYVGATDLDPDVDRDLAEQAKGEAAPSGIGPEIARKMVDRAWEIPRAKAQLQLAASHVVGQDIGDCSTKAKATAALKTLSFAQAEKVDNWIAKKAAEVAAEEEVSDGGE